MDYFKNCEIKVEEDDLVCSKSDYHKVIEAWILRYNYTFIIFFLVLLKLLSQARTYCFTMIASRHVKSAWVLRECS